MKLLLELICRLLPALLMVTNSLVRNSRKCTSGSKVPRSPGGAWSGPQRSETWRRSSGSSGLSSRSTGSGAMRGTWKSWAARILGTLAGMILGFLVILAFAAVFLDHLTLPEVRVSNATQQCVEVVMFDGSRGDCENRPAKYKHVWVQ